MLSNYCKDIVDKHDIKVGGVKKLFPNLYDKIRYPVHYKNLKHYLSLGMKLKNIHTILRFKQIDCLKVFTDFNTEKRRLSNDEFINFCINFLIIVFMVKVLKTLGKKLM